MLIVLKRKLILAMNLIRLSWHANLILISLISDARFSFTVSRADTWINVQNKIIAQIRTIKLLAQKVLHSTLRKRKLLRIKSKTTTYYHDLCNPLHRISFSFSFLVFLSIHISLHLPVGDRIAFSPARWCHRRKRMVVHKRQHWPREPSWPHGISREMW